MDERMARMEGRKQEDKEEGAGRIGGGERRQVEWQSGQGAGRVKETRGGGGAGGSVGFLSGVTFHVAGAGGPKHAAVVPGQTAPGVDAALCPEHEDGDALQDEHKVPAFKLNFQPVTGRSV